MNKESINCNDVSEKCFDCDNLNDCIEEVEDTFDEAFDLSGMLADIIIHTVLESDELL